MSNFFCCLCIVLIAVVIALIVIFAITGNDEIGYSVLSHNFAKIKDLKVQEVGNLIGERSKLIKIMVLLKICAQLKCLIYLIILGIY